MTARTTRIALAACACAALALGALPATANADTVVRFDGWVTTPGFADPMPFPTVHYTGTVDAKGWITVRPDCIKARSAARPRRASTTPAPARRSPRAP